MCDDCKKMDKMFDHLKAVTANYATENDVHPLHVIQVLAELHDSLYAVTNKMVEAALHEGKTMEDVMKMKFVLQPAQHIQLIDDQYDPEIKEGMDAAFNDLIFAPIKKDEAN